MRTAVSLAWVDGWRRVWRARGLTVAVFVALLVVLVSQIGAPARVGLDALLGIEGAAATMSMAVVEPGILVFPMPTVTVVTLSLWFFLLGGILDRLARDRRVDPAAFFAACGVYFLRFLRLALIMAVGYWLVGAVLRTWLFGTIGPLLTRGITDLDVLDRVRTALAVVFVAVLSAVHVTADYAKVRAVVEDRRSMLGAVMAALRFMRRRPGRVAVLYVANVLVWLILIRVLLTATPLVPSTGWTVFLGSLVYILARLVVLLGALACEVSLFQNELAHASYTARPEPIWPDSPAADAIATGTAGTAGT